jgi:hypothetical protein
MKMRVMRLRRWAYLVVRFDVELDLLAGEGADSATED